MTDQHVTTLGRQVAKYRREAKLSGEELAERAGVGLTRSIIANLENGRKQDVTVRQLLAIALALGVSPADLQFDLRDPYELVEIGERASGDSVNTRGITAPQYLARSWFGGGRTAEELAGARSDPHDEGSVSDIPYVVSSRDAFPLSEIQDLLDRRASTAYALAAHEKRLRRVELAGANNQRIIGGHGQLSNDPEVLRARIRDFRAELYEVDRKLRAYGVNIEEPIIYPGVPF